MSLETKRYAKDLMDMARQEGREQLFFEQFSLLLNAVNQDASLREYIDSSNHSSSEKQKRLMEKFSGELDTNVINTFFLINKNINRPHSELVLLRDFIELYYRLRNISYGKVYSVRPLSQKDHEEIEKAISQTLKEEVKLENVIEEDLIGGIKVTVGDNIWDGSYRTRMEKLRKELLDEETVFSSEKEVSEAIREKLDHYKASSSVDVTTTDNVGYVDVVADGIVRIRGIRKAMAGELLTIGDTSAMVMNLEENSIGAVLLGDDEGISEGSKVLATGRIVEVPVGDELLGRVVDALGHPIDGRGAIRSKLFYPIERNAPGVIDRQSVNQPLETGLKVIDSMIPIGKGQRELIIGDRQTGKTAIAIDTILNQKGKNVKCVYVAIGQKNSTVAQIVERLKQAGAMSYTTVVCSSASELAALQYLAPYSGCAIGEYWMENGQDVLIVYDDLSKHAIAYRTLSLLLRRPPGREAFPGDVFYLHSRLLERSAKLSDEKGGGSLTALPIVETLAGDISAYIPTNVISITDGQIFLQTEMFNSGFRPAVDSGLSVSRVGSAAQSKAMKKVSGSLKLDLAQYQEVLDFAQFGSDLDPVTKRTISHGQRLMALLKQPQYSPMKTVDQVIMLMAAQDGDLDEVDVDSVPDYEAGLLKLMHSAHSDLVSELEEKLVLTEDLEERIKSVIWDYSYDFLRIQGGSN